MGGCAIPAPPMRTETGFLMQEKSRLLLVDDEVAQLQALCSLLMDAGYDVTGCPDASHALALLRERGFDLLLSDLQMPGTDGVHLAREAMAIQPGMVAVLMTGHGTIDSAVEAMKAGVLDYILKPFRMSEIRPVIARALEVQRLRAQNTRLLEEARAFTTQLEAVNQELDSFAGRIAHDLQAVLQVTEGFATVLQRSAAARLDERESHYLQRILDTSARGNRLVQDLLSFARLGVHPIALKPVALALVVQHAQRAVELQAHGRTVQWSLGELPTVMGDASLLELVFVNLLSNALKYTHGRNPVQISVQASPCEPGWEISVRDNGVGFDPAYTDRLFQPFERLHPDQHFMGNGMGLANVRRVVERHGGSVRAQGWPGEGALFAFTLPVSASLPAAAQQPAALPAQSTRVLLVDDDPMVLLSLRNLLEIDGHQVSTAAGGEIGIEAFQRSLQDGLAFDVVITDFGMPHMDGRAVARAVKAASPGTRVVMLTGWGSRVDAMDDWQAHVDTVLGKPPRLAQVRQALAHLRTDAA